MSAVRRLALVVAIALPAPAMADIYDAAETCSNAYLEGYATKTCERIDDISEAAYGRCQDKWDAVIEQHNIVKPKDAAGLGRYYKNYAALNEESKAAYKRRPARSRSTSASTPDSAVLGEDRHLDPCGLSQPIG